MEPELFDIAAMGCAPFALLAHVAAALVAHAGGLADVDRYFSV